MKLTDVQLSSELRKNCDNFSEFTQVNIARYLDAQFSRAEEVIETTAPLQKQDLHFSILFSGIIYGEFILSMNRELACQLVADEPLNFEKNREDIFDSFKEILNMSVGKTMEGLGKHFSALTITSPKVTIGELCLPKMPVFVKELSSPLGTISCSLYIDQMQLTLSKEYEEKVNALDGAEIEKEQLKNLNKAKTEFLANMSHELRTPLNGMIGNLDLLKNSQLNIVQRQQIETVSDSGDFLLSIISDILEFSKIESGKLEVESRSFNLVHELGQVTDALANQVYGKGLNFLVNIDPSIPREIVSDGVRIKQVVMNLIGNAVKFTPKGEIEFRVGRNGSNLEFEVRDSGVGIPQEKLASIFESFSQVDVSDVRKYGGSGLGLTISQSIISALDGEISVESQETVGTVFRFQIPLVTSLGEDVRPKALQFQGVRINLMGSPGLLRGMEYYRERYLTELVSVSPQEMPTADHLMIEWQEWISRDSAERIQCLDEIRRRDLNVGILIEPQELLEVAGHSEDLEGLRGLILKRPMTPEKWEGFLTNNERMSFKVTSGEAKVEESLADPVGKVLLVEDNLINQQVATAMLESLGLEVVVASNGEEAVANAGEQKFDLIFMDCQMPVMDGYTATKEIRADQSGINCKTQIIALTANAFREVKEKCFEYGMDDFATKPIRVEDLSELIENYISSTEKKKSAG